MSKLLPTQFNCPTEFALTVLGGKWKTIILAYLSERPCHYGELMTRYAVAISYSTPTADCASALRKSPASSSASVITDTR